MRQLNTQSNVIETVGHIEPTADRITNGDMLGTLSPWKQDYTVGGKYSVAQNAGAVSPPLGYTNYLGVTSLSAYTAGASDSFGISQSIAGEQLIDLGWGTSSAKSVTLSFWVYSSLTGVFGGSIQNSALTRSFPFTYAITTASTWEKKSIIIPGDQTGTWTMTGSNVGLWVRFGLGAGGTLSGTAWAWSGADYRTATAATSIVGTNGAIFNISGIEIINTQTNTINVVDFGAIGNSNKDDTTSIQSALDHAAALTSAAPFTQIGPTVYFPPGVYVTSSPLTITKSVSIMGNSSTSVVIAATHNGPIFTVDSSSAAIYFFNFKNLRVEGRNGGSSVIGLRLTGSNPVSVSKIQDNHFRGCYTGILNEITAENYGGNSIAGNRFDNYGGNNTVYGIRYTGGHTVGDIVNNNNIALDASGYGIHIKDYAAGTIGVGDILITSNYIQLGISSIYLEGNRAKYTANFRVIGNSLMDCSSYPIVLKSITGSSFLGNTFSSILGSYPVQQDANCTLNNVDFIGGGLSLPGNLGLNVENPGTKIDAKVALNDGLRMTDSTITSIAYLSSTLTRSFCVGTTSAHPLAFGTNNVFPAMMIDSSQRVGIGEWNLSQLFTVGSNSDTTNINTRINGKTSTGASAGTLTNAPSAGNPVGYLSVNINGTERKIPYW